MMEALRETTVWSTKGAVNHTYLLDEMKLIAMIRHGETAPRFFKNPILGFSKTGRKFERVDLGLFGKKRETNMVDVTGSSGSKYIVDKEAKTCTCPGYTFRRTCKHLIAV